MEIQLLYHMANTQNGTIFKLKDKNTHPSHIIYKGKGIFGQTYNGKTAQSLEVWVNEHLDVNKQSDPPKHSRKHLNHKFTWKVSTTTLSWLKRRIKETFYTTRLLDLTLLPIGTGIT